MPEPPRQIVADGPEPIPAAAGTRRRRWPLVLAGVLLAALVLLVVAYLEGDLPEEFGDLAGRINFSGFTSALLRRYGAGASLALLYLEESGIPMPVPGDVFVLYLGQGARGSPLRLFLSWLGVILVVVAGSSNLYLLARRFGSRLLAGNLGTAMHLSPRKLAQAEIWFHRWGIFAIVFGRHIPGLRVPITVVAGTLEVNYPIFAGGVAASTAIWAGFWIFVGARFGSTFTTFMGNHRWTHLVVVVVVVLLVGYLGVRLYLAGTGRLAGESEAGPAATAATEAGSQPTTSDDIAPGPSQKPAGSNAVTPEGSRRER